MHAVDVLCWYLQSRRPDALKYRRNEFPADLEASGRDRPLCPRQFDSASDQLLTTRSTCFKHDAHKFSASHLNQKPCYKPHNFVPIYLPTPVQSFVAINRSVPELYSENPRGLHRVYYYDLLLWDELLKQKEQGEAFGSEFEQFFFNHCSVGQSMGGGGRRSTSCYLANRWS